MKAVVDTNILIDYLRGIAMAATELALYRNPAISVISWMEVMAGTTAQTESATRAFLQTFDVLEIDAKIAERAVDVRKLKRVKLPDAIILATAQVHQCLLVTRNTRDLDPNDPGVRVPYIL
ncbi:MAG TPA: type II toxin-antitoxin system VapC family toxin [Terracidiphilus sp.]|nr:type II toxin-antitoxin system VapC family toxin [Terracidiphilus sp.]